MKLFEQKRVVRTFVVAKGSALKDARLAAGLSMEKIARLVRISTVFYSDIESGRKGCSEAVKEKIEKVFS